MKKFAFLTVASLFLFSFITSAQIKKGSVLLGGGISGGTGKSENNSTESKTSSFSIYPAIGIAVKENTVVGLRLGYYRYKSEQTDVNNTYTQKQANYNAALFYRRYLTLSSKFFLFGEGAAYYNRGKQNNIYSSYTSTQKNKTVGVNLYPGVAYAATRHIHLEVGLNSLADISYTSGKTENTSSGITTSSRSSGFNFSTNVSSSAPLTVGFRIVLGK